MIVAMLFGILMTFNTLIAKQQVGKPQRSKKELQAFVDSYKHLVRTKQRFVIPDSKSMLQIQDVAVKVDELFDFYLKQYGFDLLYLKKIMKEDLIKHKVVLKTKLRNVMHKGSTKLLSVKIIDCCVKEYTNRLVPIIQHALIWEWFNIEIACLKKNGGNSASSSMQSNAESKKLYQQLTFLRDTAR